MPFKNKKQEGTIFGGLLGEKMKKAAPEWTRPTNQKNLPSSVSKGKSTKAFNRKRAGR